MIILRNARVIKELTPNFEGTNADIVIDGCKIVEIAPAKTANGETVLDMSGKTVMPGMIEAHLHLDLCGINTFEENVQPDAYRTIRALKLAQDNLRKGYTTIRDVGDRNNIIINLARAVDNGIAIAPDILPCGNILTPTEAGNDFFDGMYLEADSPMEFRKCVRKQYQLGAKWIKIMATGAVMNPGGVPGSSIIMEDELKAACETAKYVNLPVSIHCHGADGIKMGIRCGVRTIEHSSIMDDECIRMYLASKQTFPIPTMAPMANFIEFSKDKPKHYVEKAKHLRKTVIDGLRAAREAGVKIGWGTDAGVYVGSHGDGIYEFRTRIRDVGFTPLECLIQATKNNSEILMIDDTVGTLEVGKKANIVAFNGNPDESIEALNYVALVMKDGTMVQL
ncbi:amidohydrolase family protein [Clostridium thailandense]|uniref:metal-dependent hydrolase family protein n=1 Tax=Clostridium thailandense TaxID=2794346 RepID=UPI00398A4D9D